MFDVIRFPLYKSPAAVRAGFPALQHRLNASLMRAGVATVVTGILPVVAIPIAFPTYVVPSGS
jgi:hypothetical protein